MKILNDFWSTPGFRRLVWVLIKIILVLLKIFYSPEKDGGN